MKFNDTQSRFEQQCNKLNEELSEKNEQFESMLKSKEIEVGEVVQKVVLLQTSLDNIKSNNSKLIQEQTEEIINLKKNLTELSQSKEVSDNLVKSLGIEIKALNDQLEEENQEKIKLTNSLSEKNEEIRELESKVKSLLEAENIKDAQITKLELDKEQESKEQFAAVANLEKNIQTKDDIITELTSKYELLAGKFEKQSFEIEVIKNEHSNEIKNFENKLEKLSAEKDDIVYERDTLINEKQVCFYFFILFFYNCK